MKRLAALGLMTLLAACGADGEPVRPKMDANLSIGTSGVRAATGIRLGPVRVGVGL